VTPEQEKIYEDGFLAGQEQLIKSSVNKAVNAMTQRPWVGLTEEETSGFTQHEMAVVKYVSKVLQEKNNA